MSTPLPEGLYDHLVDAALAKRMEATAPPLGAATESLRGEATSKRLAALIAADVVDLLDEVEGTGEERLRGQLDLISQLRAQIRREESPTGGPLSGQVLTAIFRGDAPPPRPATGMREPWLFTAGRGEPSLFSELRSDLPTADRIDVLVSFITASGVRKLIDVLRAATTAGAHGKPRCRLRILTTTYTGATEADAVDALAGLPGCEVRIALDGSRSRLHAKAWLLHRESGFGSAYIGSANLSAAALIGGIEWTVKVTEAGHRDLFVRAATTFEALWADPEFHPYDATDENQRTALRRALGEERNDPAVGTSVAWFDVAPRPFQQAMLDRLEQERSHGRHRSLLVAATGTGKTMVAAFDYRRLCSGPARQRLLFVAHRREILEQARKAYRQVLRDSSFGEMLTGESAPSNPDHLFATIDSVVARDLVARHGPDHWDVVVFDECHRMGPETRFDEVAHALRPRFLLGLTATPERADGRSILPHFDLRPDGSPAVELRLWDALDQQLVVPFEYFGCDDATDLSRIPWDGAGERAALSELLTGNTARARIVIDSWRRLAGDPKRCRALAFCVTVEHAEFMARCFNEVGIPALCVHGETPRDERARAPQALARGALRDGVAVLTTVDLYNEGVDIPEVDTLLLLRPTQSPVIFQQQLGRGLRHWTDGVRRKESCLVIDLVGRHRAEFRFDRLLGPITGLSRRQLVEAVEGGFSGLPPGCHVSLEPQTRDQVLRHLRSALNQTWRNLASELQAFRAVVGSGTVRLARFISHQGLALGDVYDASQDRGWTALKRRAGLATPLPSAEDGYFGRRFSGLLHMDDVPRLGLLRKVAEGSCTAADLTPNELVCAQMLANQIDGSHNQNPTVDNFIRRLAAAPAARAELAELAEALSVSGTHPGRPISGLEDAPLTMHAAYERREIASAVGWWTSSRRPRLGEGVIRLLERKVELLLVTLDKSEGFHERVAYRDCALSPTRFQWETQNACGPDTATGRRYLESPGNDWAFQLFVRETPNHPFRALGPVTLASWHGDRPMTIVWTLLEPVPGELFLRYSALRG